MLHAETPIDAVTDLLPGFAFRGAITDEPPGPVHVVNMANALGDSLTDGVELPSIDFTGDQAKLQVLPGDLIFRSRGVSNQAVLVESMHQPAILASPLIRIRVRDLEVLDPRYLQWVLNSGPTQRAIDAIARGTIVRMVTAPSLRQLKIPVPPMVVQQRIAAFALLQREEQSLSAALIEKRRLFAEQVLWAKAQEVR